MTLPASGAIKFSDLQTEYGGTNPISLGEYRASYRYTNIYVALQNSGVTWTFFGPPPAAGDVRDTFDQGVVLQLRLQTPGYPIYLSTTDTPGATDLLTTGVTNNGSSTDESYITFDTATYTAANIATSDGQPYYRFYIKSTAASGLTAIPIYLINPPSPVLVRYLGRTATVTWPSTLQGGSGNTLVSSGAFITSTPFNNTLLKNGQSIQMKMDCFTLGDINSGGAYLYTYINVVAVTGNHPSWSFGATTQMGWGSNAGTGSPNYMGASAGGLADTASNVASLAASTCSSARVADINPITGMTLSATASGTTVTWTLTNNTGSQYYVSRFAYNDGTYGPILVWLGASTNQLTTDASRNATWGSASANRVTQAYGVPLYAVLTYQAYNGINYYSTYTAPDGATQAQIIAGIKAGITLKGLTVSNITDGLRIDGSVGDLTLASVQYFNQHVGLYSPTASPGASNITATLTNGPAPTLPAEQVAFNRGFNSLVPIIKENIKLSHFYGEIVIPAS